MATMKDPEQCMRELKESTKNLEARIATIEVENDDGTICVNTVSYKKALKETLANWKAMIKQGPYIYVEKHER